MDEPAQHSSDDGWIRGPALEIVRSINGWRVGDVVEVDTAAWAAAHGWAITRDYPTVKERVGIITTFCNAERPGCPVIQFPSTGRWNTACDFIIAWRPKKRIE